MNPGGRVEPPCVPNFGGRVLPPNAGGDIDGGLAGSGGTGRGCVGRITGR